MRDSPPRCPHAQTPKEPARESHRKYWLPPRSLQPGATQVHGNQGQEDMSSCPLLKCSSRRWGSRRVNSLALKEAKLWAQLLPEKNHCGKGSKGCFLSSLPSSHGWTRGKHRSGEVSTRTHSSLCWWLQQAAVRWKASCLSSTAVCRCFLVSFSFTWWTFNAMGTNTQWIKP